MSRLHKVDAPFTTVDNAVAEDSTLSYRARGVLVSLLAKPDGWSVRADAIARGGKEGRDAILTALRELGARGHYRIVRYRDGSQWKTVTEIAHRPVQEWADEWAASGGGPVVANGNVQVGAENGISGLGDDDTDDEPDQPPDPETGFPASGNPASGRPASGQSAALVRKLNNETEPTSTAAAVASTGQVTATVVASTGAPGTEVDLLGVMDAEVVEEDEPDEPDMDAERRKVVRTLVAAYVDVVTARGGHCTGSILDSIGKNVKRVVERDGIPEGVLLVAVQKAATRGERSLDRILAAPDGPQASWDRSPAARRAMQESWIAMGRKLDAARGQEGAA